MQKPINIKDARRILTSLFDSDKLTLKEQDSSCLLYFNGEPEPRFSAPSWREIIKAALPQYAS